MRACHIMVFLAVGPLCSGCSALEWLGGVTHARLDSAEMKPYLDAVQRSPRETLGFTSLPTHGPVQVEVPRWKKHYDVMLHIDRGNLSRTVDFVLHDGQPVWSGEQEIHYSGRKFNTVDGTVRECLVISYSTVKGPGTPKGGYVEYWGTDETLRQRAAQTRLSVADAKALWESWPK